MLKAVVVMAVLEGLNGFKLDEVTMLKLLILS